MKPEHLIARLRSNPRVKTHGGAGVRQLMEFQRFSTVKVPKLFLEYLKELGFVRIDGKPVFGLGPDAKKAVDIDLRALDAHIRKDPQLPSRYLPIADDRSGGYFCLDPKSGDKHDCPVARWSPHQPDPEFGVPERVAPSFAAWILGLLGETLPPESKAEGDAKKVRRARSPKRLSLHDRLLTHPAVEVHPGASDDEIARLETRAGRRLPSVLIGYLRECGFLYINGEPMFGLGPGVERATSMFERADFAWTGPEPVLPKRYLPLADDGAGGYYCLDLRAGRGADRPVVHWDHELADEPDVEPEVVAGSFAEWLHSLMDEAPEGA